MTQGRKATEELKAGGKRTNSVSEAKPIHAESFFDNAEELLALITSSSVDPFLLIDKNLKVQLFNRASYLQMKELLQVDLKKGADILQFAKPERIEYLKKLYADVFNGNAHKAEIELGQGKHKKTFLNFFNPAYNSDGLVIAVMVSAHDVTGKKKTERNLIESEERWRFALEGSKLGLWDWNIKSGNIYYSNSWRKLFHFAEDAPINDIDVWKERIHPDDREKANADLEKHLKSANPYYENTYRLKAGDDKYHWILAKGMILERDAKGNAVRMIGTHTDITEKKASEENYKLLFYTNPLPMFTFDWEARKFIEVNHAALSHYGYTQEEFLALKLEDLGAHEDFKKIMSHTEKDNLQNNFSFKCVPHKKKNGEQIFVNLTGQLYHDNGRKTSLILAEDITEVIVSENKLKESEKQYRLLFEDNPLPSLIYNIDTLEILQVNKAATVFYGIDKKEFLKKTLFDFHTKDQLVALNDVLKHNKDKEIIYLNKWKQFKKDKTLAYVDITGNLLYYHGIKARLIILNDITEKVFAEDNLRISNERFKLAAKAAAEALWEWDIEKDSVYISPVYKEMFGFDVDLDRNYQEWHDYIHPDEREEVTTDFYKTVKDPSKDHWQKEYRYLKSDGEYLHIVDHCVILRNASGKATKVVGAMQNITKRKEAEKQILISNERFRLASKATSDAIYDWDINSNNLMWGEGMEKLFGYQQLSLSLWEEKLHPDDAVAVITSLHKTVFRTKKNYWTEEYRFMKADGTYRYILEKGFIVREALGNPVRMIGAMQDITDIKLKEQQLRISNERFDAVMKATHDLIWDWNLETGKFYRDKEGLKTVYGVEDESGIQNIYDWLKRVHPADHKKVGIIINQIIQASVGDTFDVEYRFRRDDGTYSNVYDRGIIIRNNNGKPVRMIGAAQDITDRKRLEQQLLEEELGKQKVISKATIDTQEKERSEIGKELHDNVNQVLTTTKLYLELSLSNNEIKDDLIKKSSENIMYVINEIRQLSRSLMNPSIGDLGLIDSVKDLVEDINVTRKLHVVFKCTKEVESLLSENQNLMVFRIIQEGINNIIKHANAKNVLISINKKDHNIMLTISDDGKGFDINAIKKGSGLKSIQNRVYLASGNLKIESSPEKGSKMIIEFPNKNSNPE